MIEGLEYYSFLMYFICIAGSSNGRTGAFEASNFGSIPSPAAIFDFGRRFRPNPLQQQRLFLVLTFHEWRELLLPLSVLETADYPMKCLAFCLLGLSPNLARRISPFSSQGRRSPSLR